MFGKTTLYYEKILKETESAFAHHRYRGKEYSYSRLRIYRIIPLNEWNSYGNPNVPRKFKEKTLIGPQQYNYWDYQAAWEHVLYIQNHLGKHSWWIRFMNQMCLPNWFIETFWAKFGAIKEIMPKEILKKQGKNISPLDILQISMEFGLPWIMQWD